MEDNFKKGTTTVAIVCDKGVVLATDKRASAGYLIAHKNAQKLFKITESVGVACAGVVGDIQSLIGLLRAEANLYEMKDRKKISTKALAQLTSNILQGQRYYPLIAWLVLGGYDSNGAEAYSIDPIGGVNKDTMISTGSGSTIAYGLLEDRFRENMTIEEGIELSIRAINVAIQRDLATGDGIAVTIIDSSGYKELSKKEIENVVVKVKNK
ncbi:MAG: archaeal proteasome endopeptidase complex subunit beta [Methanomicrobia archaeon]|nr:archaeal proteasome endopeptidase complex subunit beta [Methanomicrobia archaeon]MCK4433425.1 archaeal proteasome endopeptidase complex subunit beta [Methanomicrobia archaeon]